MKSRNGTTLIDALVVVAVFAMILVSTSTLIVDGFRGIALAQQRSETNRLLLIVKQVWQETLRESPPETWSADDADFRAGSVHFAFRDKALNVETGPSNFKVPLPGDMTPRFSIEAPAGLAACAVMNLTWTTTYRARTTTNQVRLVACGNGSTDA